ncbi:MAG: IS30 family transposase [Methylocella sp.]
MPGHLTSAERDLIAQLVTCQHSLQEIATALGRDRSTIFRELKRNTTYGEYLACQAQRQAEQRQSERPLVRKCDRPAVDGTVRKLLSHYCSPDQIAARMKLERADRPEDCVSASTVYRWIEQQGEDRSHWREFLRRRGRRPHKARATTSAGAPIAKRPEIVEERGRIGDFEGDLVLGKQGTGGLNTLVDRKSRYTILMKVVRKEAAYVYRKTRERLKDVPADKRHSVTYDNGGEFAKCPGLEQSAGVDVYYAEPGCPYQRGTNENTNGLARQFFPKGTDFQTVTHAEVRETENLLNHRPRAILGYRTPHEVFHGLDTELCCN